MYVRFGHFVANFSPQTEVDAASRIINQDNISLLLLHSTLEVFVFTGTDLCYDATNVDLAPLRHTLDAFDVCKLERLSCNRHIVLRFGDL